MPTVGLVDDIGRKVPFAALTDPETRWKDLSFQLPRPVLLRLSRQKVVYEQFEQRRAEKQMPPIRLMRSPTANAQPARIAALERLHNIYIDPKDAMAADLGTQGHNSIEQKTKDLHGRGIGDWWSEVAVLWCIDPARSLFMPMMIDLLYFPEGPDDPRVHLMDYKYYRGWKVALAQDDKEWEEGGKLYDVRVQLSTYAAALQSGMAYTMELDANDEPTGEIFPLPALTVEKTVVHMQAKEPYRQGDEEITYLPREVQLLDAEYIRQLQLGKGTSHAAAQRIAIDYLAGKIAPREVSEGLPLCSDDDMWIGPPKWEVWRQGGKAPSKSFDGGKMPPHVAAEQAHAYYKAMDTKYPGEYSVKHIEAKPKRCCDWCNVAPVCKQFAQRFPHLYNETKAKKGHMVEPVPVRTKDPVPNG